MRRRLFVVANYSLNDPISACIKLMVYSIIYHPSLQQHILYYFVPEKKLLENTIVMTTAIPMDIYGHRWHRNMHRGQNEKFGFKKGNTGTERKCE